MRLRIFIVRVELHEALFGRCLAKLRRRVRHENSRVRFFGRSPITGSVRSGQSFVSFSPCGAVSTSSASAFGCALEDPAGARGSSGNSSSSLASMREFRFRAPRAAATQVPGPRSQVAASFFAAARRQNGFCRNCRNPRRQNGFCRYPRSQVPGCGEFRRKKKNRTSKGFLQVVRCSGSSSWRSNPAAV